MAKLIWILSVGVLFSLQSQALSLRDRLHSFSAGAHRGGVRQLGDNTLKQFRKAMRDGVAVLEMDLRTTKDGVVVVMHNSSLDGSTNCRGNIADLEWGYVKNCVIQKSGGQTIPSFAAVLELVNGRAVVNAEFKDWTSIKLAINLVGKLAATDWVFFQTQSSRDKYFEARATSSLVNLLYKAIDQSELDWALNLVDDNLVVIELPMDFSSQGVIEQIHRANKLALEDTWRYVWHQEQLGAACDQVFKKGVDIAISNSTRGCVKQAERFNRSSYTFVNR